MSMKLLASAMALVLLAACETGSELDDGKAGAPPASSESTQAAGKQDQGVDARALAPPPGSRKSCNRLSATGCISPTTSTTSTPRRQDQVAAWANWLTAHSGLSVVVEGHADERGTREYNLALGERRAAEVRSYLLASGIDANRVRIVSYGKERPVAVESNEDAWALNRRAVMILD